MNTKIYEYIIAVYEHKNITRAARQCYISQPALTQHIKKLEAELGFHLFEKEKSGWIPTRQGEVFLTTAKRMLQIEKETYEKIKLNKKNDNSTYRIFVDFHMRNFFIDNILPPFTQQYPDLKLSLISGDTETALDYLQKELIEIAIIPTHVSLPIDMDCVPVAQNEYLLILPSDHESISEFRQKGINLQQLKEDTFILTQSFSLFSSMQNQILEQYNMIPNNTLSANTLQSTVQMVGNGQGITLLPDVYVHLVKTNVEYFSLDPPWYFQHVVAYKKSHGLKSTHALIADLLIKHYSQFHD